MPNHAVNSFQIYLFKDKINRLLIFLSASLLIIQFIVFKTLYPFPSFISDSYSYLEGAYYNLSINTYPIGYSKFLRTFNSLTYSDTVLVGFQYLAIQIAGLWLVFTLSYLYATNTVIKCTMVALMVLNPVLLFLSNFISSDPLFLALSLCWFTLLVWYLNRPSLYLILLQSLALLLSFTVRYNALYYPLITLIALLISKQSIKNKIIALALTLIPIGLFVESTSAEYKQLTGIKEFNPFAGWQIANNALDAYQYVQANDRIASPPTLSSIDYTVCQFFDKLNAIGPPGAHIPEITTAFMWTRAFPLQVFMTRQFAADSSKNELRQWASMGPLYSDYGYFIVRNYPVTFTKYYLWPNIVRFYTPPVWHLEKYNMGTDSVRPIAKYWFNFISNKVHTAFKDYQINILDFAPIMAAIMNTLFLLGLVTTLIAKSFRCSVLTSKINILATAIWITNFGFSVFASPIQLRYQVFNILLSSFFGIILFQSQIKSLTDREKNQEFKLLSP
jgi:hypothetical protein